MKQINNDFLDIYYLTDNGKVYNTNTKQYLSIDNNSYKLRKKDGKQVKISLKKLYRMVYNKEFCIDNIENLKDEEWKPIIETDGLYFVSNKGRIKSYHDYKAKILKPQINNSKYYRVDMKYKNIRNYALIHRIVAEHFLPLPNGLDYQIHHKDFNTLNNCADNLIFLTRKEHIEIHRKRGRKEND